MIARRWAWGPLLLLAAAQIGGCSFIWERENRRVLDTGVDPMDSVLANSAAYRDTIGALTYYQGRAAMHVRGYGLVAGLGDQGTTTCPKRIYDQLVQSLYKFEKRTGSRVGETRETPEAFIRDPDSAVVLVEGFIPGAATVGTPFDVTVRAIPGTETKSLIGGRLYSTELRLYRPMGGATVQTGKVLAKASGPVFSNPFTGGESATDVTQLEGGVIGGGVVTEDRRINLVLMQPSYGMAKRIQERINSQFGSGGTVADATSPSFVRIHVPPEYDEDQAYFLALVRGLFLSRDPSFAAGRAVALAEEIVRPDAPHALIAVAFEALGRPALPELNRLYTHPLDYVSFHAAAAGMRLEDHVAADAMTIHAEDADSAFRMQAIRALALARGMAGPRQALRRLLDDEDPRIRIAAYEALIEVDDRTIVSHAIGKDNFHLDLVPTTGPPFIYAKRTTARRIALFGEEIHCGPPMFYASPDGALIINAALGAPHIDMIRAGRNGTRSPPVKVQADCAAMIRLMGEEAMVIGDEIMGLSLDYSAVVRALFHLAQDGSISAEFVFEQPDALDLTGATRQKSRPETD